MYPPIKDAMVNFPLAIQMYSQKAYMQFYAFLQLATAHLSAVEKLGSPAKARIKAYLVYSLYSVIHFLHTSSATAEQVLLGLWGRLPSFDRVQSSIRNALHTTIAHITIIWTIISRFSLTFQLASTTVNHFIPSITTLVLCTLPWSIANNHHPLFDIAKTYGYVFIETIIDVFVPSFIKDHAQFRSLIDQQGEIIRRLQQQLSVQHQTNATLAKELARHKAGYQNQLKAERESNVNMAQQIKRLQQQVVAAKKLAQKANQKHKGALARLHQCNEQKAMISKDLKTSKAAIKQMKSAFQAHLAGIAAAAENERKERSCIAINYAKLEGQYQDVQAELAEEKQARAAEREAMEKEKDAIEKERAAMKKEREDSKNEKERLQSGIDKQKQVIKRLLEENARLRSTKVEEEKRSNDNRDQRKRLIAENTDLKAQQLQLSSTINGLHLQLDVAAGERDAIAARLHKMKKAFKVDQEAREKREATLQKQVKVLRWELREARWARATGTHAAAQVESETTRHQLRDLKTVLLEERTAREAEKEAWDAEFRKGGESTAALKDTIKGLEDENANLQVENGDYRHQVLQLDAERKGAEAALHRLTEDLIAKEIQLGSEREARDNEMRSWALERGQICEELENEKDNTRQLCNDLDILNQELDTEVLARIAETSTVARLEEDTNRLHTDNATLHSLVDQWVNKAQQLQAELELTSRERNTAALQGIAASIHETKMAKRRENLEAQVSDLQKELVAASVKFDDEVKERNQEKEGWVLERAGLKTKLKGITRELSLVETQRDEARAKVKADGERINAIVVQLEAANSYTDALKAQLYKDQRVIDQNVKLFRENRRLQIDVYRLRSEAAKREAPAKREDVRKAKPSGPDGTATAMKDINEDSLDKLKREFAARDEAEKTMVGSESNGNNSFEGVSLDTSGGTSGHSRPATTEQESTASKPTVAAPAAEVHDPISTSRVMPGAPSAQRKKKEWKPPYWKERGQGWQAKFGPGPSPAPSSPATASTSPAS